MTLSDLDMQSARKPVFPMYLHTLTTNSDQNQIRLGMVASPCRAGRVRKGLGMSPSQGAGPLQPNLGGNSSVGNDHRFFLFKSKSQILSKADFQINQNQRVQWFKSVTYHSNLGSFVLFLRHIKILAKNCKFFPTRCV